MAKEERATEGEPGADDVEQLNKALAAEKEKAEGYLANWQRAQADFINYKRRSEQEREELSKYANAQLILALLPALDDLQRALEQVDDQLAEHGWVEGIRLIERKLRAGLEANGLTEIKAQGEMFDPRFHEAAMHVKGKDGVVLQELQKGYMLHDRVIRPTKVVVGNGESDEDEESAGEEAE